MRFRTRALSLAAAATVSTAGLFSGSARAADIVDVAASSGSLETLTAAIEAADMVPALKREGAITVFAPTNAAFDKLPEGELESLLQPENGEKLRKILKYHVVIGTAETSDITGDMKLRTIEGGPLRMSVKEGGLTVNGAKVVQADIEADNGVIHIIDRVLMPGTGEAEIRRMIRDTVERVMEQDDDRRRAVAIYTNMLDKLTQREEVPGDLKKRIRALLDKLRSGHAGPFTLLSLRPALNRVYAAMADEQDLLQAYADLDNRDAAMGIIPGEDFEEPETRNVQNVLGRVLHQKTRLAVFQDGNIESSRLLRLRVHCENDAPLRRPETVAAFLRMPDGSVVGPSRSIWVDSGDQDHYEDYPFLLVEFPKEVAKSLPSFAELIVVTQAGEDGDSVSSFVLRH